MDAAPKRLPPREPPPSERPAGEPLPRRAQSPLDRSRQAAPQIVETLRQRILSLSLKPNTVLQRAALQVEFGVSQTPVRDALMKLEQEGLVDIYPQHATLVARIDIGAARQAHFLRLAIEAEAVRRIAPQRSDAFLARLEAHIVEQRRLRKLGDHAGFNRIDRDFHRELYEEARIPDLWQLVRRHSGHIDRLRLLNLPLPGKVEAVLHDHKLLVEALEKRDADAAAAALRQHLSGTLSIIDQIRETYPDYLREE